MTERNLFKTLSLNIISGFFINCLVPLHAESIVRNPSAHWPKECSSNNTIDELNTSPFTVDSLELSKWSQTASKPKFVAIVVHGLNLRPSKMDPLILFLNNLGGKSLRVALEGHRGSLEEQKLVTWTKWLDQYHDHYCLALKEANKLQVPLINFSFSLGALVSLGHIAHQEANPYDRMVMMAPAAWIHWYGKVPQWFSFLGSRIGVPSKNLEAYRSQKTTSLAAYEAMGQGRQEVAEISHKNLKKPTMVIIDPDDELVSIKKMREFIREKKLNDLWQVMEVSNEKTSLKKSFHHLIVDKDSLGENQWKLLLERLSSFLDGEKHSPLTD